MCCQANTCQNAPTLLSVLQVFNIPIVLVSLVDEQRQWFKSVVGLPGVTETDRKSSFCAWTLLPSSPECLIVSDARKDARFRNNKLVTVHPGIQFYGGCPLVSSVGLRMGSFCVIDLHKRLFTAEDCNLLCNCAEVAVRELELQRAAEAREFGSVQPQHSELRNGSAWQRGTLLVLISALPSCSVLARSCCVSVVLCPSSCGLLLPLICVCIGYDKQLWQGKLPVAACFVTS
jgi:GAF domain-containing protein